MENPNLKWMRTGGSPHDFGNLHMVIIKVNLWLRQMDKIVFIIKIVLNNNRWFLGTKGLSENMVPMDPLLNHHVPSPFFGWPLSRPPFSEIPHLKGPEHNQYIYIYIQDYPNMVWFLLATCDLHFEMYCKRIDKIMFFLKWSLMLNHYNLAYNWKTMQPTNPNAVTYNTFVKQVVWTVLCMFPLLPVQCRLWNAEEGRVRSVERKENGVLSVECSV